MKTADSRILDSLILPITVYPLMINQSVLFCTILQQGMVQDTQLIIQSILFDLYLLVLSVHNSIIGKKTL